jgi:hypothetical protein
MPVVRYREENGKISRKHGNTLIRTLRKTYGPGFAPGCADHAKLSDVLAKLDESSLSQLIRDHEAGFLHHICGDRHVTGTEPDISARAEQRGGRSR